MNLMTAVGICIMTYLAFDVQAESEYHKARRDGAMAEIMLTVLDDQGLPVTNASIRTVMDMSSGEYSQFGKTGTNGMYIVYGKTNGNYVRLFIGKEGYYGSIHEIVYANMQSMHDVKDGKWQPYGDEMTVILKKIRNPIKMPNHLERKFIYTKEINKWLGFDLKAHDFVTPHGNGIVADFELFFEWDGKFSTDYTGMELKIRFPGQFSGYSSVNIDDASEFKGPYAASPVAEYLQSAAFYEHVLPNAGFYGKKYERSLFDRSKCWVVRSRCVVNNNGELISSHYSLISNIEFGFRKGRFAVLLVNSAFNTTPNDTNLEDIETAEASRNFIRQCEPPLAEKGQ